MVILSLLSKLLFPAGFSFYFIIIILTFFFYNLVRLFYKMYKFTRLVSTIITDLQKIENNKYFKIPWIEYQKTFDEDGNITEEDSSKFFNKDTIISKAFHIRYWAAVPGLLVGIGILGTFLGLSFGIMDFGTDSPEEILTSIDTLLSGMGTAFSTSIWGMFLSIIFNIFEKSCFRSSFNKLNKLNDLLNKKYKASRLDIKKKAKERHEKMLKDLFAPVDEEGKISLPKETLRDLLNESEEQTASLKHFSTDLADGIKISNETIEFLGNSISDAINSSFEAHFIPVIKKLEQNVEELQKTKESSSVEFISEVVDKLEGTIDTMLSNIHQSLSSSAISALEDLSQNALMVGNSLQSVPEIITKATGELDGVVHKIQENVHETSLTLSKEVQIMANKMKQESNESIKEMTDTTALVVKEIQSSIERLQQGNRFTEKLFMNYQQVLKDNESQIKEMNASFNQVEKSFSSIQRAVGVLQTSTQELQNVSTILKRGSDTLTSDLKHYLNEQKTTLSQLEKDLLLSRDLVKEYGENFEVIQSGLSSIFQQIDVGLKDYSSAVKESLNSYLQELSTNLNSAVNSLSGSIIDFQEVLESIETRERRNN